jgi:pyruvate dehydrogenase E2 component (dihydrolipoamide acetyltransferase)
MRFEMKMPDVATNDTPVRIVRWIAVPGQAVRRGEPLVEVETDKATVEVESVRDCLLVQILVEAGNTASSGDVLAVLETAG